VIAEFTADGDADGLPWRYSAATPAACGDAIDVPEMVLVAVLEVYQADVMLLPGANTSTQLPKLENEERASVFVVEPVVSAEGARAGETLQAFWFSFPAATTTVTPAVVIRATAESVAEDAEPPRLMLATEGPLALAATQSMPAITPELDPEPEQSNTRTGIRVTCLATPYVVPPTVPATWVPCPLQSVVPPPSLMAV
jgi:hypothetical protein